MKEDCKEGTWRSYRYMEKLGCYTIHIKVKSHKNKIKNFHEHWGLKFLHEVSEAATRNSLCFKTAKPNKYNCNL